MPGPGDSQVKGALLALKELTAGGWGATRMKQQLAHGGWGRALCSEGKPPWGALIHTEGRGQDGLGGEEAQELLN